MCRGRGEKKRNIPLDIWLYIRVFWYYILYNFYKRVFEFMCMTKKRSDGIFIFLQNKKNKTKNSLFSAFTNIQLRCLKCMIKENSTCNSLLYQETFLWEILVHTLFIANKTNTWLHLNVVFFPRQTLPTTALQKHGSHCCMKEELWCQLFRYVRRFELGSLWAVS